jgi:hypothetical protein
MEDRLSLHELLRRLSHCYPRHHDQLQILSDLLEEKSVTEQVFTERQAKSARPEPEWLAPSESK